LSTDFLGSGRTATLTYQGGDGNDVAVHVQAAVNGTPGDDVLVLRQVSGDPAHLEYSLNGAAFVPVSAALPFTFNGQAGADALVVDFVNGSAIPAGGVFYDGGTQNNRDVLVVRGNTTQTAAYQPDGTTVGKGQVAITGITDTVHFDHNEVVDLTGMAQVNVVL